MRGGADAAAAVLAGWLLFAGMVLSIGYGMGLVPAAWLPGGAFWVAGALLITRVRGAQRLQTLLMIAIGSLGLGYAGWGGASLPWQAVLAGNQALLAMLAAVSFLRLISLPRCDDAVRDPAGRAALWRTLAAVHLFGAVINLSALMLLADHQSRRHPLTLLQALVLSRGFSLAALWSPFFAAMGIAISHAPGAQLAVLAAFGFPVAVLGLLFSAWSLGLATAVDDYRGFPIRRGALWLPAVLAALVMIGHQMLPSVPILTLIAGLALGLTLVVVVMRDQAAAPRALIEHVGKGLPRMSAELALFLAAAVLAAGISGMVSATGWHLDLREFGAVHASVLLVCMVVLAVLGVHPVISIATSHGVLAPLHPDPNLLGMTYLMGWAAGVSSSPLSGLHLALQGRYAIDVWCLVQRNLSFTLFMLALDVSMIHGYVAWRD